MGEPLDCVCEDVDCWLCGPRQRRCAVRERGLTEEQIASIAVLIDSAAPDLTYWPGRASGEGRALSAARALLAEVRRLQDQVRAHVALSRDSTAHAVGYARAVADAAAVCEEYRLEPIGPPSTAGIAAAIRALATQECPCADGGPGSYDGPQRDCPQHGALSAGGGGT